MGILKTEGRGLLFFKNVPISIIFAIFCNIAFIKNYETYNRSARVLFSNKCLYQVELDRFKTNSNNFYVRLSQVISSYLHLFWSISSYLQLFWSISSYLMVIWLNLELSGSILVFLWLFLTISAYSCLYLAKSGYLGYLGLSRATSGFLGLSQAM